MAVNEALIKAVGRAYAPKFQKTELFSESSKQKLDTVLAARKAEKIVRDQRISAIVSEVQNVDISVTPPEQINQQYEISGNIRNEVAALAAQRAKLPQNSPQAFAIDQMINQKKQMFSQVVANAKDFKELHEEYIKAEGWNMSAGVDPEKRKQLDAIFIDKNYTIEYDENGSPTYKTEFGEMSQTDLSNYFVKDDEMALSVTNYSEEVLTSGEQGIKLEGARKDILYRKILNDINKGGPSRLKSLIYDDLVEGQSLGLSEGATAEDAAEAIVKNLINVNNQGLATYQDKQNKLNNNKEEKDNRTASEITRSTEAKIKMQNIERKLDVSNLKNPKDASVPNQEDLAKKYGLNSDSPPEQVNRAIMLEQPVMKSLGDEITNMVSVDGGAVIQKDDGTFVLRRQNNSGTVIRSVDITDEMLQYFGSLEFKTDKQPLYKKIGLTMGYTEGRDYPDATGSIDDKNLD